MFRGECYTCGERWELGTPSTCKCKGIDRVQQPVVYDFSAPLVMTPHTAFAKREWVGLADNELEELEVAANRDFDVFATLLQAKLKEKNHERM